MNSNSVAVRARSASGNSNAATVQISYFSRRERLLRALKLAAISLAIALTSALVPVAHFVLVPLFVVLAPIAAAIAYKRNLKILGGEITCPSCQRSWTLQPASAKWPLKEICPHCRSQILMDRRLDRTFGEG